MRPLLHQPLRFAHITGCGTAGPRLEIETRALRPAAQQLQTKGFLDPLFDERAGNAVVLRIDGQGRVVEKGEPGRMAAPENQPFLPEVVLGHEAVPPLRGFLHQLVRDGQVELQVVAVGDVPVIGAAAIDDVAVSRNGVDTRTVRERMAHPAAHGVDHDDVARRRIELVRPRRNAEAEAAKHDPADRQGAQGGIGIGAGDERPRRQWHVDAVAERVDL